MKPILFNEHAAIITVISLQIAIILQVDRLYNPLYFVISALAFWFGIESYRLGYADTFGRVLMSINVGVAGAYAIIGPAIFLIYFGFTLSGYNWPFDTLLDSAMLRLEWEVDIPGRLNPEFNIYDAASIAFALVAFVTIPRRQP